MDTVIDAAVFLGKFLYYFLESLVYKIIPKRKKKVAGEIVLITGAGHGLGRELAIKFARLGAILVLWDIYTEGNEETSRLAKKNGGAKVFAHTCDCSNRQEIYQVAEQPMECALPEKLSISGMFSSGLLFSVVEENNPFTQGEKEVGDVTILINNAGIVSGKPLLDIPDHMVEKSFLVNTLSHFWTYKAFLPAMIKANHGHLVCISSAAGLCGVGRLSDYCGSKFAAFGFAESILFELHNQDGNEIKTTIICPYFIKTGMSEGFKAKYPFLLPQLEQEYVAQIIIKAILEDQVYVTMPKLTYILVVLKQIMSVKMTLALLDYLGITHSVDSFNGRANENDVQAKNEEKQQ